MSSTAAALQITGTPFANFENLGVPKTKVHVPLHWWRTVVALWQYNEHASTLQTALSHEHASAYLLSSLRCRSFAFYNKFDYASHPALNLHQFYICNMRFISKPDITFLKMESLNNDHNDDDSNRSSSASENAQAEFRRRVIWWTNFIQHRASGELQIEVSAHPDGFREEMQIRARGELVLVGLVRMDGDDLEAPEITAQTTISELLPANTLESRTCFVANSTISFYQVQQAGDVQNFAPIADGEHLDPQVRSELVLIRQMLPRFILENAAKLGIRIEFN